MSDISLRGLHVGSTIASHLEAEVPLEPPAFWMKWKKSGGASGPSRERMVRLRSNGLSEKCALSTPAALGRQNRPRGGPVTAIPAATVFSDFRHTRLAMDAWTASPRSQSRAADPLSHAVVHAFKNLLLALLY